MPTLYNKNNFIHHFFSDAQTVYKIILNDNRNCVIWQFLSVESNRVTR